MTNLFSLSSEVHTTDFYLNSARKNLLHISKINTETYGNKSIKHHCATLWNESFRNGIAINSDPRKNLSVIDIKSSHHLKKVLKKHYLFKYSMEENWFIYFLWTELWQIQFNAAAYIRLALLAFVSISFQLLEVKLSC